MIRVTQLYGRNTESRTAFYQLFKIQDTKTGRGAVVYHWGPIGSWSSEKEIPKDHGQVKINTGTSFTLVSDLYNDALKKKRKSGYKFGTEDIIANGSLREAQVTLDLLFRPGDVEKILKATLPDEDQGDEDQGDDDMVSDDGGAVPDDNSGALGKAPTPKPDTNTQEKPKHDAWGTW